VATGCSDGSTTSSPHPAKAACPSLRARRPGRAVERRRWKKGHDTEEGEEAGTVRRRRRLPGGGARGGVLDPAMVEPSTSMSSRALGSTTGAATERGGV
jgi:hypothetical protein